MMFFVLLPFLIVLLSGTGAYFITRSVYRRVKFAGNDYPVLIAVVVFMVTILAIGTVLSLLVAVNMDPVH